MIQSGMILEISGRICYKKVLRNHSDEFCMIIHPEQKLMLTQFSLTSDTFLNGVSN